MYRDYENPRTLEKRLAELKQAFCDTEDEDERISLHFDINELEDRIARAYEDEAWG